jgi:DNA polymerase (family 10)
VGREERDVYEALDLQWVPPEVRGGADELRAAETGTLPALITRRDVRGDLHMHTHYSDGRDSVEAMVRRCIDLGYEYLAITDHSPNSSASRNLTLDSVRQQADEIAEMRERFPQIAILHGCEVDILPDERLDFPDRVLEQFDLVLASLHDPAGQGPDELLRRYVAAMHHPLVTIITHPSNRLVPNRDGYDLDYDRLFATAVETGTVVEIDGAPTHLDLDGPLARRAVAAGAMLSVDSDSHRAEALARQMDFGLMTARRGWVEARHVLNARPLAEIQAFIRGKRRT